MALDGFAGMERHVCPGEGGAVVYWVHNYGAEVTLALLHVSNGGVRLLQFTGLVIALFFVGDCIITVMINSP